MGDQPQPEPLEIKAQLNKAWGHCCPRSDMALGPPGSVVGSRDNFPLRGCHSRGSCKLLAAPSPAAGGGLPGEVGLSRTLAALSLTTLFDLTPPAPTQHLFPVKPSQQP
jgi:hypothetical protein